MWDTSTCCATTVTTDLSGINRASDRSQRKKSNFTEFLGTNSQNKLADFVGIFGANFAEKKSVKNNGFCGYFQGKFP